jgi:hypothetical protein
MDGCRELIKKNIDYDALMADFKGDKRIAGIVEILTETVCSSKARIRIAGEDYPASFVRERFLKLDHFHIGYVLGALRKNTTLVRDIRAYMLAALFNAPTTMGCYYESLAGHALAREAAPRC